MTTKKLINDDNELQNTYDIQRLNDLNNQHTINNINNQKQLDNLNNPQNNLDDINNQQNIIDNTNNQNDEKQRKYKRIYDILFKLYFTDKNFDGIEQLLRKAKVIEKTIKRSDVKQFLESTKSYQMTYHTIIKKTYPPIYSERPYSFQIDLSFIPQYKEQNKGIYV